MKNLREIQVNRMIVDGKEFFLKFDENSKITLDDYMLNEFRKSNIQNFTDIKSGKNVMLNINNIKEISFDIIFVEVDLEGKSFLSCYVHNLVNKEERDRERKLKNEEFLKRAKNGDIPRIIDENNLSSEIEEINKEYENDLNNLRIKMINKTK